MNARQRWLVFLTALTITFDGLDNQLLGITMPDFMRDWNLARSAFAPVVSLGYFGMMIGGACAGLAGDRLGRRVALLGSILVFGVATLAVTSAHGVTALGLLRLIAGIGLGGAIPNATALAAEYVPVQHRAMAVTLTIVCVPLGGVLGGVIAIPLLPSFGWRGMFVFGGSLPIAMALIFTKLLPESPLFLARAGAPGSPEGPRHESRAPSNNFAALFEPALRVDTIALWIAFFSNLIAVYLAFSWVPAILSGAGLGNAVASSGLTAFNFGGVVGAIAGGLFITRLGSRVPLLAMSAGAAVGALVLSRMPITAHSAVPPLIAMLAVTGGFINAVQVAMFALAAHVYPTAIRATGVGTAVAIGRMGAISSGYAGPWALAYGGSGAFFGLMAACLCVTLTGLALVRRHITASS